MNNQNSLLTDYGLPKNSFKSLRAKVQTHKQQNSCSDMWNQIILVQKQLKKHEEIQQSQKSNASFNSQLFIQRKLRPPLLTERNKREKSSESYCFDTVSLSNSRLQNEFKLETTIIKASCPNSPLKISNRISKRLTPRVQQNQKTQKKINTVQNVQKSNNKNSEPNKIKTHNSAQLLQMTTKTFECLKNQFNNDQNKTKKLNKIFKELILMIQI